MWHEILVMKTVIPTVSMITAPMEVAVALMVAVKICVCGGGSSNNSSSHEQCLFNVCDFGDAFDMIIHRHHYHRRHPHE